MILSDWLDQCTPQYLGSIFACVVRKVGRQFSSSRESSSGLRPSIRWSWSWLSSSGVGQRPDNHSVFVFCWWGIVKCSTYIGATTTDDTTCTHSQRGNSSSSARDNSSSYQGIERRWRPPVAVMLCGGVFFFCARDRKCISWVWLSDTALIDRND